MKKYFIFFVISVVIFFTHAVIVKHAIYGDGNGYYSYTNTLYFQRNLNFDPIYNFLENFKGTKYTFSRVFWDTTYAKGGIVRQNVYLIGTGLTWLPSMAFISSVNSLLNLNASRFDLIYELGPGLSGILFIIFGLYFLEKYLLNFVSKGTASFTILAVFLGSYIFYYSTFEPALSHQPSFFLISFLLYWTYNFKPDKKNLFLVGIFSGLLAIVRIVDIILLIPMFLQILHKKPLTKDLLFLILGGVLGALPQLIFQYLSYGTILMNNYLICQNCGFKLNITHSIAYLFSPVRGFFIWSPIYLIGVWGLIKQRKFSMIISIIVLWIVTSSWPAYLSAGFGQRYSFSACVFLAIGIAYLFDRLKKTERILYIIPFGIWNALLLTGFYVLRLGR